MNRIYLDHNSTTPIATGVAEKMQPFLREHFGNPSSVHVLGRAAAEAIEDARSFVSGLIGADPDEIVFTSGGTEANNLAIKGSLLVNAPPVEGHVIISAVEHPAVVEPARSLERLGVDVTIVPVDGQGRVDPEAVAAELRPDTRLVSVMHSNNEIGTLQPIRQIASICRERGVLVHTDASQSMGKVPINVDELGVDLLTIAGHKMYAPKGVGALYVRSGVHLEPLLHGAGHERGRRSGTENTPYLVGLGHAAKLAGQNLDEAAERMARLRDWLQAELAGAIDELVVFGSAAERLPNTLAVSFPRCSGPDLLARIPELCASTGSACHSGMVHSGTLAAMGVPDSQIRGLVRLSLGWSTTDEDVERAANLLVNAWESLAETSGQL